MENISEHISYKEATRSAAAARRGIDNTPNEEQLAAMKLVAKKCFEPARKKYGPLYVSSFFRCLLVNSLEGGSSTSDHPKGCAIDIDCDVKIGDSKVTNAELFNWLKKNVKFDQLIWEYGDDKQPGWVHVSYRASGNRGEVLRVSIKHGKKQCETIQ